MENSWKEMYMSALAHKHKPAPNDERYVKLHEKFKGLLSEARVVLDKVLESLTEDNYFIRIKDDNIVILAKDGKRIWKSFSAVSESIRQNEFEKLLIHEYGAFVMNYSSSLDIRYLNALHDELKAIHDRFYDPRTVLKISKAVNDSTVLLERYDRYVRACQNRADSRRILIHGDALKGIADQWFVEEVCSGKVQLNGYPKVARYNADTQFLIFEDGRRKKTNAFDTVDIFKNALPTEYSELVS